MSISDILDQVSSYPTKYVTVTGGEPLSQKSCLLLLEALCVQGCIVSIETSGAIDVSGVDSRVMKVMDIKTPGSGEVDRNLYDNLKFIGQNDEIKFVICNREDYEWAKSFISNHKIFPQCQILFSPEQSSQDAAQLAEWVLEDGLNVRLQLQLHKLLWGNTPGK